MANIPDVYWRYVMSVSCESRCGETRREGETKR
ncbi:hypothetical protein E2C01_047853 [Portunus trituberculatus]|uniref:Uncharacterized protein n=1 Tax=Portunus trituberculatus TaxID=210409 RepID=A0A5B7G1N1_PORTR|nr:hypothetical protein [Portunus trituberculatus]